MTDYTAAIQSRIDYALAAGSEPVSLAIMASYPLATRRDNVIIWLPAGNYDFIGGLVVDLSNLTSLVVGNRIIFIGAGSGLTRLSYTGTDPNGIGITIKNQNWTGGRSQARLAMKGIYLHGNNAVNIGGTAVAVDKAISLIFEDVFIVGWYQAINLTDVVAARFVSCQIDFNNYGIVGQAGAGLGSGIGSPPNELLFSGTHFNSNRQYALWVTQSANIVCIGGSFENNGITGAWDSDAERWGIRLSNGGYNGSNILGMYGTHFEGQMGTASIWIEHGDYPGIYNIDADFVRNGTKFETNNILFETTGAAKAIVNSRSGHWSVNGYAPSVDRKYIGFGAVTGTLHRIETGGSLFFSDDETPTGVYAYGQPL